MTSPLQKPIAIADEDPISYTVPQWSGNHLCERFHSGISELGGLLAIGFLLHVWLLMSQRTEIHSSSAAKGTSCTDGSFSALKLLSPAIYELKRFPIFLVT